MEYLLKSLLNSYMQLRAKRFCMSVKETLNFFTADFMSTMCEPLASTEGRLNISKCSRWCHESAVKSHGLERRVQKCLRLTCSMWWRIKEEISQWGFCLISPQFYASINLTPTHICAFIAILAFVNSHFSLGHVVKCGSQGSWFGFL